MKLVFNGITFENEPYILHNNTVGLGVPPASMVTQKTIYQHGSTFIRSYYEDRKIDFEFSLKSTSQANFIAAKNTLYAALNPQAGELDLEIELHQTRYARAVCEGIVQMGGNNKGNYWQTYQISFTCHDPFFYSAETSQLFTPFSGGFSFPFSFPFSLGTPASTQTLINSGDYETPVRIVLVGPLQEAIIENQTTGEKIYLTEDIAAGETVTINTQTKTVTSDINGNVFNYISTDTVFWNLEPGNNIVTYKTSTNILGSSCTVYWKSRYSGI